MTSRVLAERVRDALGTVIVDNKAGAGGNIGADAVAKAAPDGLTIGLAATATHAVNPWLYSRMPYDAAKDFAGITQMVRVPNVLVMNAAKAEQLKIHTVADLIAYAKANPAKLNYGSGGNGSAGHLAGEMFKQRAGIYALHIPYRGASPAQLALLAGEVDFKHRQPRRRRTQHPCRQGESAGRDLAAGVADAARRAAAFGYVQGFFRGHLVGARRSGRTPKPVIAKLNKAFVAALNSPETRARFTNLMAEPVSSTPEQFDAFMASERAKYQQVVKASGAKVD